MKTNNNTSTIVISISSKNGNLTKLDEFTIKKLCYELSEKYSDLDISFTTDESSELISKNF